MPTTSTMSLVNVDHPHYLHVDDEVYDGLPHEDPFIAIYILPKKARMNWNVWWF